LLERCTNYFSGEAPVNNPPAVQTSSPRLWIRQSVFNQRLVETSPASTGVYHQVRWNSYLPNAYTDIFKVRHANVLEDWASSPSNANGENIDEFTPYDQTISPPPNVLISKAELAAAAGGVNVRSYGAKGDGVSDDTIAIQAAIAALPADTTTPGLRGGILYFPAGRYIISSSLDLSKSPGHSYWVMGDTRSESIIQGVTGYTGALLTFSWLAADKALNKHTTPGSYQLEDMTLKTAGVGFGSATGTYLYGIMLQRVTFDGMITAGIWPSVFDNSNSIVDCNFINSSSAYGFYHDTPNDYMPNGTTKISHIMDKSIILRGTFSGLKEGIHTQFTPGQPGALVLHSMYRDCVFSNIRGAALNLYEVDGVVDNCVVNDCGMVNGQSAVKIAGSSASVIYNLSVTNSATGAPYLMDIDASAYSFLVCGADLSGPTTTGQSLINRSYSGFFCEVAAFQGLVDTSNSLLQPATSWQRTTYNLQSGPSPTDHFLLLRQQYLPDINFLGYGYVP
jgi:hypothetical protein